MKQKQVLMLLLALMALLIDVSDAKTFIEQEGSALYTQSMRTKIKKEELPEAARKTLEGDAFKGWTVAGTYKTTGGDFEVDMKKGDTTQTIKFDKDGKIK